jgi:DNA modification methylase
VNYQILVGDVIESLRSLPEKSVQCVVTSPPYWNLRDYGVPGQIGLEPTPEEHVEKMVEVFREVKRVLRDDGTVWLNLGDCYAATGKSGGGDQGERWKDHGADFTGPKGGKWRPAPDGLKPKDLVGMPWRIAFALQADSWYLRSDIIWSKSACVPSTAEDLPNPMPESVTDRPTRSHEYIFLLSKRPRYFYDADAVREAGSEEEIERRTQEYLRGLDTKQTIRTVPGQTPQSKNGVVKNLRRRQELSMTGTRNRRTVWEIATQPTPEAHFATFPQALVEPCIKAGTSERGCCPVCGAPWVREVEKGDPLEEQKKACGADSSGGYEGQSAKYLKQDALGKQTYTGFNARWKAKQQNASDVKRRILEGMRDRITSWHPSCTCGCEETVPCVVLDIFMGSGTTLKVARDLKRSAIGIELNPEYVKIAQKRLGIKDQKTLETGVIDYQIIEVSA